MFEQLKKVAAAIDDLLRNDPYPDAVRPEYLRNAVRDYPVRGGKRMRPALLIWSAAMLGADERRALYPAAAAEVWHNWTLVHDDIIDQDRVRRGAPTEHVTLSAVIETRFGQETIRAERFGRAFAMLAGDLQQGWANDLILRSTEHGVSTKVAVALSRNLQKLACRELISGEALDVEFSFRKLDSLSPKLVREMLYLKTGALLRFCTESGAMIALDDPDPQREEVRKLGEAAAAAGIAFQLRDDYLGIFGEAQSFGKPLGNDLREGKATILLMTALQNASPSEREELIRMIGLPEFSENELARARQIIQDTGAVSTISSESAKLTECAISLLMDFPDNPYRQYLLDLTSYLVSRTR